MTDEKRRHGRLPLVMEVTWEGSGIKRPARTTDISSAGCFVDTLGLVDVGQTLNLKLTLPDGEYLSLQAEVMYQMPGLGFGVRFTNGSEPGQSRLEEILMESPDSSRTA